MISPCVHVARQMFPTLTGCAVGLHAAQDARWVPWIQSNISSPSKDCNLGGEGGSASATTAKVSLLYVMTANVLLARPHVMTHLRTGSATTAGAKCRASAATDEATADTSQSTQTKQLRLVFGTKVLPHPDKVLYQWPSRNVCTASADVILPALCTSCLCCIAGLVWRRGCILC